MWSAVSKEIARFSQASTSEQAMLTNSIDQVKEHNESVQQERQCPGAKDPHEPAVECSQSLRGKSLLYCHNSRQQPASKHAIVMTEWPVQSPWPHVPHGAAVPGLTLGVEQVPWHVRHWSCTPRTRQAQGR